jgi:hypothetical protein
MPATQGSQSLALGLALNAAPQLAAFLGQTMPRELADRDHPLNCARGAHANLFGDGNFVLILLK